MYLGGLDERQMAQEMFKHIKEGLVQQSVGSPTRQASELLRTLPRSG